MRLTYRRNVGRRDRAIRVPSGVALLVMAAGGLLHPIAAAAVALAGFALLESGITGY
ncbi:MAG: YgaP-like transmembrane domain [Bacillota bacterium]